MVSLGCAVLCFFRFGSGPRRKECADAPFPVMRSTEACQEAGEYPQPRVIEGDGLLNSN